MQSIPVEHSFEGEDRGWFKRYRVVVGITLVLLTVVLYLSSTSLSSSSSSVVIAKDTPDYNGDFTTSSTLEELEQQDYASLDDEEEGEEEEGDEETTESPEAVAMRSMPELEYNEDSPDHLYLLYNPGGGMSNQIMELENAITLARFVNRTLYVPRIASHTNFVSGYLKLGYLNTFPADRLLDFTLLTQYARVIPLNLTNRKFTDQYTHGIVRIPTEVGTFGTTVNRLKQNKAKLVYLSGNGMWKWWFQAKTKVRTQHFVAYSPHLRSLAMHVARKFLQQGQFYAIHGRLGDQADRWEGRTSQFFVQDSKFKTWGHKPLVYLASDDPNSEFFRALRDVAEVKTLKDLDGPELQALSRLFASPKVRNDMLGVVDKLVCIQALDFIGTGFSTFTWDIRRYRGDRKLLFPELFK
ncbi:hypothetical protein BASA81_008277 [Batrachochytrium salamandrivorans]|nr:hypothetical protein BASA81_008277 [Batrachochytrium salamandrivorans]